MSTHEVENIGHFVLEFNLLLVSSNQVTNAVRISQKFFTMLLLVEKWKFLQGEVLVQNLRPRRLKFLFEVLLWIPPQPEVTMELLHTLSLKLMVLKETGPFQLKLFTRWAPQVLKCSAQKLQEVRINKTKFANRGVRCSQQNSEVQVHQICQENWHPVWSSKEKPNHEVSSKSMHPWQWSDKKTKFRVGSWISVEVKTVVRRLSFSRFSFSWSFQQSEVHQTTKTIWNKVKCHGYPKLPGSV